ncbi:MAG: sigma-70 family RNA polymerase sigma factor [Acidimicrobiia bacterium]|nr:sigma-70 family RNA polymerase sigma factor [Acidimicrobiia bacterium]
MGRTNLAEAGERELVAAISDGDEVALAEAVRRHRAPVVAFARRLVGDDARAEEISQDVFVRLWERSDRFDDQRGSLRSFLLAVTHGRSIDVVRSDSARRMRELRDSAEPTPPPESPESAAVAGSVAAGIRRALAQLPENERRAVELAYVGGHSYRTVAEMLEQPEGTVKSRIRSGLAKLRTLLAEQDLDP